MRSSRRQTRASADTCLMGYLCLFNVQPTIPSYALSVWSHTRSKCNVAVRMELAFNKVKSARRCKLWACRDRPVANGIPALVHTNAQESITEQRDCMLGCPFVNTQVVWETIEGAGKLTNTRQHNKPENKQYTTPSRCCVRLFFLPCLWFIAVPLK